MSTLGVNKNRYERIYQNQNVVNCIMNDVDLLSSKRIFSAILMRFFLARDSLTTRSFLLNRKLIMITVCVRWLSVISSIFRADSFAFRFDPIENRNMDYVNCEKYLYMHIDKCRLLHSRMKYFEKFDNEVN